MQANTRTRPLLRHIARISGLYLVSDSPASSTKKASRCNRMGCEVFWPPGEEQRRGEPQP
jgi:hypothetical protein